MAPISDRKTETRVVSAPDFLSAVTPEIRVLIYEFLAFSPRIMLVRYPHRSSDPAPDYPILRVNRLFRKEALPILFKDVHLLMTPHPGLRLDKVPKTFPQAMPCWAKFAQCLQIVLVVHAFPVAWPQNHGLKVALTYELTERGKYWIWARATIPHPWTTDYESLLPWMRSKADELEERMGKFLREDKKLQGKVVKARHSPALRIAYSDAEV